MKTTAKQVPTAWRDVRRDWNSWSEWEQRAIMLVGVASSAFAFVWFALSLNLAS